MENSQLMLKKFQRQLLAHKEFWWCNLLGWACYNFLHSVNISLYSGSITSNFIHFLPTCILGVTTGALFHLLHTKKQWYSQHPMSLFPLAVLIAIFFATIETLMYQAKLIPGLAQACAPNSPRPPFTCGQVTDAFRHSLYAMLLWTLGYILIVAEQRNDATSPLKKSHIVKAVVLIIGCRLFECAVITMSYVPTEYKENFLYSKVYFIYTFVSVFFCSILATFTIFLRPAEQIAKSRIVPLLPTILILTFSTTVLSMWGASLVYRITHIPNASLSPYLFFGGDSFWPSPNAFAGALRESFQDGLIAVLLLIALRFSSHWKIHVQDHQIAFDIKKSLQFWAYNIGGWVIVSGALYFSKFLNLDTVDSNSPIVFMLAFITIGIFMGVILRTFMRYYQLQNLSLINFTYKVFVVSLLFGFLQACTLWFCNYIYNYLTLNEAGVIRFEQFVIKTHYFYTSTAICILCCFLWSLIYQISAAQRQKESSLMAQLQLENNLKNIQLNTLSGKIDPHFIFNALNNIRALIKEDSEKAREAVLILSDILRNPITTNSKDKVIINAEINLVRNYITLSKIQLERRLEYSEDIDASLGKALIPAMMLQIMVENAIKHGISPLVDGGTLALRIFQEGQQLKCILTNTGELNDKASTSGFGVGLSNIKERIFLLYGNNGSFNLTTKNKTVIAELVLPIEYLA
jgi:sensor histidine kinase YesM